jgi:hypothetical protein
VLNSPLNEILIEGEIKTKTQSQLEQEEIDKENEQKRINAMDNLERRRYEREQRKKIQIQQDLAAEKMLFDAMT